MALLVARASMTGFVVFDYADRYPEAFAQLSSWLGEGRLSSLEHTVRGDIEMFPSTLLELFKGTNTGKLVLELS
jgi:NADPH-dependent curcumin reductase CurA